MHLYTQADMCTAQKVIEDDSSTKSSRNVNRMYRLTLVIQEYPVRTWPVYNPYFFPTLAMILQQFAVQRGRGSMALAIGFSLKIRTRHG